MPTLYHYSPLIHLPPILAEGLCRGEIAQPNLSRRDPAVSLTTQTDPEQIRCWGTSDPSIQIKLAVRYVCDIVTKDPLLQPALSVWRELRVPPKFLRLLDPAGQAKWWHFYRGVIRRERFQVQFRGRNGYVTVPDADLPRIGEVLAEARGKFNFVVPEDNPRSLLVGLKNPRDKSPLWLVQEAYPADRFLTPAS